MRDSREARREPRRISLTGWRREWCEPPRSDQTGLTWFRRRMSIGYWGGVSIAPPPMKRLPKFATDRGVPDDRSLSSLEIPANPTKTRIPRTRRELFVPGTIIRAELTKSVDVKKAKVGDIVTARFVEDFCLMRTTLRAQGIKSCRPCGGGFSAPWGIRIQDRDHVRHNCSQEWDACSAQS